MTTATRWLVRATDLGAPLGEFPTYEEAIAAGPGLVEEEAEELEYAPATCFYVDGVARMTRHLTGLGETIVEDAWEQLFEIYEDCPSNPPKEAVRELDGLLAEVFREWLERHGKTELFWEVVESKRVDLPAPLPAHPTT